MEQYKALAGAMGGAANNARNVALPFIGNVTMSDTGGTASYMAASSVAR